MVDEGTDISNKSLMIYYFQFVENYKLSLKFLDILEIKDKTAKGLNKNCRELILTTWNLKIFSM